MYEGSLQTVNIIVDHSLKMCYSVIARLSIKTLLRHSAKAKTKRLSLSLCSDTFRHARHAKRARRRRRRPRWWWCGQKITYKTRKEWIWNVISLFKVQLESEYKPMTCTNLSQTQTQTHKKRRKETEEGAHLLFSFIVPFLSFCFCAMTAILFTHSTPRNVFISISMFTTCTLLSTPSIRFAVLYTFL